MSQQLQQTRYDQLIRRAGGLIGGGSKVSSVIPELFPVLELENTTPELLALGGWRLAWQSTERPAAVGFRSASQLRNPPGSGMLMAVTQIILRCNAATVVQAEISTTEFGTPVAGLFRDSRFGTPRNTAGLVASVDDVGVGGGLRIRLEIDTEVQFKDDNGIVVLSPGANLDLGTTATNVVLTVNYWWRERVAEASELSFP